MIHGKCFVTQSYIREFVWTRNAGLIHIWRIVLLLCGYIVIFLYLMEARGELRKEDWSSFGLLLLIREEIEVSVATIFLTPLRLLAFPRDLRRRKLSLVKEIM